MCIMIHPLLTFILNEAKMNNSFIFKRFHFSVRVVTRFCDKQTLVEIMYKFIYTFIYYFGRFIVG